MAWRQIVASLVREFAGAASTVEKVAGPRPVWIWRLCEGGHCQESGSYQTRGLKLPAATLTGILNRVRLSRIERIRHGYCE
jgi:hypothetical protein